MTRFRLYMNYLKNQIIWKTTKKIDYDDCVGLSNEHLSNTDTGLFKVILGNSPSETISFEANKKVVEDFG